jgi:glycosyltransferase involved in cell wall biosynthesis
MARENRDHQISLLLNGAFESTIEPIRASFEGLVPQERIHVWFPGPGTSKLSDCSWLYEASASIRSSAIHRIAPDVFHVTSVMEGLIDEAVTDIGPIRRHTRVIATCYDLIPLLNKDVYLPPSHAITPHYYDRLDELRKADRILAISNAARSEIITNLPAAPDRVINIDAACDTHFSPVSPREALADADLLGLGIDRPFLLYTGGADTRKNLHRLIEAFASLPEMLRQSHQLAIVGRMPDAHQHDLQDTASRFGLSTGSLVLTGWISDQRLRGCYNLCAGFVFPSLHEGFGLPALEAMACGAPTIAARASSLIEIVRREEAMFDPTDVGSMRDSMCRLLSDEAWRDRLRLEGIEESRRYSWGATASLALDAMESLASEVADPPSDAFASPVDVARRIASLPQFDPESRILPGLADRIVASLPAAGQRLLLDVSTIVHLDVATGIQRVVRALVTDLLRAPPEGFEVVLVQGARCSKATATPATMRPWWLATRRQPSHDRLRSCRSRCAHRTYSWASTWRTASCLPTGAFTSTGAVSGSASTSSSTICCPY